MIRLSAILMFGLWGAGCAWVAYARIVTEADHAIWGLTTDKMLLATAVFWGTAFALCFPRKKKPCDAQSH